MERMWRLVGRSQGTENEVLETVTQVMESPLGQSQGTENEVLEIVTQLESPLGHLPRTRAECIMVDDFRWNGRAPWEGDLVILYIIEKWIMCVELDRGHVALGITGRSEISYTQTQWTFYLYL